eukprot:Awhi_evm1s5599
MSQHVTLVFDYNIDKSDLLRFCTGCGRYKSWEPCLKSNARKVMAITLSLNYKLQNL